MTAAVDKGQRILRNPLRPSLLLSLIIPRKIVNHDNVVPSVREQSLTLVVDAYAAYPNLVTAEAVQSFRHRLAYAGYAEHAVVSGADQYTTRARR
jgi:hypothetical protein